MIQLSRAQLLKLHRALIDEFGGESGIRDLKLLDMSLQAPFQTYDGHDLYPGAIIKMVHLSYSIIKNHPFLTVISAPVRTHCLFS